jgi:hypothetical protein
VLSNQELAAAPALALRLAAAANGVQVVLPEERKFISLPPAALARIEGSYQLKTDQPLWVLRRGDTLWARLGNQPWTPLRAESSAAFYAPQVDAELHFALAAEGPARAARLPDLPGSPTWPRAALPLPSFTAQKIYLRGTLVDRPPEDRGRRWPAPH